MRGRKSFFTSGIALIAAFFVFGLVAPAHASSPNNINDLQLFKNQQNEKLIYLSNEIRHLPLTNEPKTSKPADIANQALEQYGHYFGIKNSTKELSVFEEKQDNLGMYHVRYGQAYNGVPVFGAQTIVHLKNNLDISSINGQTVPDININTTPLITQTMAVKFAQDLWKLQGLPISPLVLSNKKYIFNPNLFSSTSENKNSLVWRIELFKKLPGAHEIYFINAISGELIFQISGNQDAISRRVYDCSLYAVIGCRVDYSYSGYTYGRSEGQAVRGQNPVYSSNDTNNLYDILGTTHNYFNSTFSRNGANNLGGLGDGTYSPTSKTDGYVYIDSDVSQDCPNAYFDGFSANFCDGLVFTDVVAHEYGHGVEFYSILDAYDDPAGLIYSGESGALNESYADIFGEAVENYSTGTSDWLMGESVNEPGLAGPLRSFSNPTAYRGSFGYYPDRFYSPNYYCLAGDGGGVHHNSSVPNYAAYLMAMGGTFNGCTISAIGKAKEEVIFYRAMTTYLTPSSGFNAAYTALNSACADIYGATSSDCINVKKALQAVEMDQAGACSSTPRVTPACSTVSVDSVTASNIDGYYNAGKTINITVNFEGTTTGSGIITFDSGGTCSISVSAGTSATCVYTILAGENSTDLNIASITGSFTNTYNESIASLTPIVNLATSNDIIVDTTPPTGTLAINEAETITSSTYVTLSLYGHDENHVPYMRFSNDNATWSDWESPAWTKSWTLTSYRGLKTVYVQYQDSAANITTVSATINYLKPSFILTAPGSGTEPLIKAFGYTGKLRSVPKNLYAFDKKYKEGIHLTTCDVDGDLIDEIVASYGPKQEPWVKVFRQNGKLVTKFLAYGKSVKGGVYLACGDVDGNGVDEIITGVPEKFSPQVRIFNGTNGKIAVSKGFFAFSTKTKFGLRLATGDVDGNGVDEIIVGSGNGATSQVKIFNASGSTFNSGFYAYGTKDRTGINVAAGDVNGDGVDEIITGSGKTHASEIKIYSAAGTTLKKFSPFGASYKLGVKISTGDINGDGIDEIITSKDSGSDTAVRVFTMSGKKIGGFFPYDKKIKGGVETAVGYLDI